jgi:hypothetical protein
MASCSSCGTNVGCGCNLTDGMCVTCYGKQSSTTTRSTNVTLQTIQPSGSPEFVNILNQVGLTQEEKLKRINDILEAARLNYGT